MRMRRSWRGIDSEGKYGYIGPSVSVNLFNGISRESLNGDQPEVPNSENESEQVGEPEPIKSPKDGLGQWAREPQPGPSMTRPPKHDIHPYRPVLSQTQTQFDEEGSMYQNQIPFDQQQQYYPSLTQENVSSYNIKLTEDSNAGPLAHGFPFQETPSGNFRIERRLVS